jgi:hypothetical protein
MVEDNEIRNLVSPHSSILWVEDNAYARTMERLEYAGRVSGTGLGPLPIRSTCYSSTSESRMS